jgi:hypothetical protein
MFYADNKCSYVEGTDPETGVGTYTFIGPCVVTGKEQRVTVKAPDLFRYRQGGYVQSCFPYLTADQREFLISGTSAEGWTSLFGKEEEE